MYCNLRSWESGNILFDCLRKQRLHTSPPPSNTNCQMIRTNGPTVRLYQVWEGSNRFFLGGRLIFGPDVGSLFLTLFLILAPVILFCAFVSHGLVNSFPRSGLVIVTVCAVYTGWVIVLLFLTSGRDPGIVPRNSHPPGPDDEGDTSSISTDWAGSQSGAPTIPMKIVTVNGSVVRVKYCQTCMLYRPPRCSHCSICNNCVERFDHHCPWVGQCIGKVSVFLLVLFLKNSLWNLGVVNPSLPQMRTATPTKTNLYRKISLKFLPFTWGERNYRFFFMFVSSTTLLCLYVLAFSCIHIKKIMEAHHCNLWKALLESPVSGILIVYTFVVSWFVGGLTAFHMYLVISNQTTYENFRNRYERKMNPYNLGCIPNLREIFCSEIPSSKNNFRAQVKVDPLSVLDTSHVGRTMNSDMLKTSFDMDMEKRQAVDAEELQDMKSQIGVVSGFERCGTQPRHSNRDPKGNWEMIPDIHVLVAEFGTENRVREREEY